MHVCVWDCGVGCFTWFFLCTPICTWRLIDVKHHLLLCIYLICWGRVFQSNSGLTVIALLPSHLPLMMPFLFLSLELQTAVMPGCHVTREPNSGSKAWWGKHFNCQYTSPTPQWPFTHQLKYFILHAESPVFMTCFWICILFLEEEWNGI